MSMKAGMDFLSCLYYGKTVESLSNLRYMLFTKKRDPPKIKSLPQTREYAAEHIKHAWLQVFLWRAADNKKHLLCLFMATLTLHPKQFYSLLLVDARQSQHAPGPLAAVSQMDYHAPPTAIAKVVNSVQKKWKMATLSVEDTDDSEGEMSD